MRQVLRPGIGVRADIDQDCRRQRRREDRAQRGPVDAADSPQRKQRGCQRTARVTGSHKGVGFALLDQAQAHAHRVVLLLFDGQRVLVHLDDFGSVHDAHGQAGRAVFGKLHPHGVFLADQDDLDAKIACSLNCAVDHDARRVIAAHGIDHDSHVAVTPRDVQHEVRRIVPDGSRVVKEERAGCVRNLF